MNATVDSKENDSHLALNWSDVAIDRESSIRMLRHAEISIDLPQVETLACLRIRCRSSFGIFVVESQDKAVDHLL